MSGIGRRTILTTVAAVLGLTAVADAAPPAGGLTATTTSTTDGSTTGTSTTLPSGPWAEIAVLADFLAQELGVTFSSPVEEVFFYFAVAELYFQYQRAMMTQARMAANGGTQNGTSGFTSGRSGGGRRGSSTAMGGFATGRLLGQSATTTGTTSGK